MLIFPFYFRTVIIRADIFRFGKDATLTEPLYAQTRDCLFVFVSFIILKKLNCRIPVHFGPPHLHVSGGSENRGITQ